MANLKTMAEEIDLFERLEELPKNVLNVISNFEKSDCTYNNCDELQKDLEELGYTFEYGLDSIPYNLKKIENV